MQHEHKPIVIYFSALIGSALMMLLRLCDRPDIWTALLVLFGMTALIFSLRHASKKEWIGIALAEAIAYAIRFYGYTGEFLSDFGLGFLAGLIMFGMMALELPFKKYKDKIWYTLIFPVVYLIFMYFTEIVKVNMPFRLDTFFSFIPVLCQIVSPLGIYSLDFLIAWTVSVIVFLTDHWRTREFGVMAAIYGIVLVGVLGFGLVHMNEMNAWESTKTDTARIACITGPYLGSFAEAEETEFTIEETLTAFRTAVSDAAKGGAEILVFCEEAYCVLDTDEQTLLEEAGKMAAENHMHLLLAYEVEDTDNSEGGLGINKLCWISDQGEIIYDYIKKCLVPVVESGSYVTGTQDIKAFEISLHGTSLQIATAICYDEDFEFFMSSVGKRLDLLIMPTSDWEAIGGAHFGVARLRAMAAESTLVRSVYDGWNGVIDSAGNLLYCDNTNDAGYQNVLFYDVPIR